MASDGDPPEPKVRFHSPMPAGYVFVPKGDVFVTKLCRKKTHDDGRTLFVVIDKNKKPIGLRCPSDIFEAVDAENKATASRRADAVQRKDAATEGNFEKEILRIYPKIPKELLPRIVKHALQKRSRRVGTTGTIDTDSKVTLAVRAHIRHVHTDYHKHLRETGNREASRALIHKQVKAIETLWGRLPKPVKWRQPVAVGPRNPPKPTKPNKPRKAGKAIRFAARLDSNRPPLLAAAARGGRGITPTASPPPNQSTQLQRRQAARVARVTRATTAAARQKGSSEETQGPRSWREVDGVVELLDDDEDDDILGLVDRDDPLLELVDGDDYRILTDAEPSSEEKEDSDSDSDWSEYLDD